MRRNPGRAGALPSPWIRRMGSRRPWASASRSFGPPLGLGASPRPRDGEACARPEKAGREACPGMLGMPVEVPVPWSMEMACTAGARPKFRHVPLYGSPEESSAAAKKLLPSCAGNAMPAFSGSAGAGSSGRAVPLPAATGTLPTGPMFGGLAGDGRGCPGMIAVGDPPLDRGASRRQGGGRNGRPHAVRDRDAGRGRDWQDASPMYGAEVTVKPRHGRQTSCVCPVSAMTGDAWGYLHHHAVKISR
jgi:hypothetical protein